MALNNRSLSPPSLVAILTVVGIWLLTHRYTGIQHDGIFYAAQVLARESPQNFSHDLFFAFGSQDDYSLFSIPYGLLAGLLGIGPAALILLISAHIAWAVSAAMIAHRIFPGNAAWMGLALLFGLNRAYGSDEIFHYAENFLTARVWAEALTLGAIAASIQGRRSIAISLTVIGFTVHPIITLPGLLFVLAYHIRPDWRSSAVLVIIAAATACLLPTIDAQWLEMVIRRAPFLLLNQWQWGELLEPFTWIGILLVAGRIADLEARRVHLTLALVGIAGIYLALLGTLTHATVLIQAQPWRSLWLVKAMGLLALTGMFVQRWKYSAADRWLLMGLGAAAITADTLGGPTAMVLAGLAHTTWCKGVPPTPPRWLPISGAIALTAVLAETALSAIQSAMNLGERLAAWVRPTGALPLGDLATVFTGPLAILLPLIMILLLKMTSTKPRSAIATATLLLILSSTGWYRAGDVLQNALFQKNPARPFGELIPRSATIQWDNNFLYTWFLLRQGNYASIQQSVGIVFSRDTAMEAGLRLDRLAAAGMGEGRARDETRFDIAGLTRLCTDTVLDGVIHAKRLPETNPPEWNDPVTGKTWHLYSCQSLRPHSVAIDLLPQLQQPQFPTKPPHHPPAIPTSPPV